MRRAEKKANDIDGAAAAWAVRLDAGEVGAVDRESLERWLEEDPRHKGALVRAQAIWADLDRVAALHGGAAALAVRAPSRYRLPVLWWALPVAACLLLAVAASSLLMFYHGRFASQRGQVSHLTLTDGSSVVLDTDSVIRVRYTARERGIYLRSGAASFQVVHDAGWPFVVHAEDVTVRAVGTSFVVSLRQKDVQVTVAEGTVEVRRLNGATPGPAHLVHLDHELVYQPARPPQLAALQPAQVDRKLAWRRGLLIFDGEDLAEAAAQVNRYASVPIVVDDEKLGQHAFVGVFRIGESKAFADSAAAAFDAKVVEEGGAYHLTLQP
jgi:transmembrane sensor